MKKKIATGIGFIVCVVMMIIGDVFLAVFSFNLTPFGPIFSHHLIICLGLTGVLANLLGLAVMCMSEKYRRGLPLFY